MSHSLIEISRSEWAKLRDLYKNRKECSLGYNLLQNYIDWVAQNSALDVKIYSLDGVWEEDGTFIVTDQEHTLFVCCNTLSDNLERLTTALNCLDKKLEYLIFGYQHRLLPAIEQHFIASGFSKEDTKPEEGTFLYHIKREKGEKLTADPPAGISLARLSPKHAEQVNSVWPHRSEGSIAFVDRMIRYNDSVGAFDEEGNLVAWCLRLPLGALGLLQVLETHKRKGLGSLLVSYMTKLILSKNQEVWAPVVFKNVASGSMFKKLGFEIIDKGYWSFRPGATEEPN